MFFVGFMAKEDNESLSNVCREFLSSIRDSKGKSVKMLV